MAVEFETKPLLSVSQRLGKDPRAEFVDRDSRNLDLSPVRRRQALAREAKGTASPNLDANETFRALKALELKKRLAILGPLSGAAGFDAAYAATEQEAIDLINGPQSQQVQKKAPVVLKSTQIEIKDEVFSAKQLLLRSEKALSNRLNDLI